MKYNLPAIPNEKKYIGNETPEQSVQMKILKGEEINTEEELILKKCIDFYKTCFPALKAIPLSEITDEDLEELKTYLSSVFNFKIIIQNDINFEYLFRVTPVNESFVEKGKVRTPKYLTYPPLDIVKKMGKYNRANSPEKTVFYASFFENVALRETKPEKGQHIIISTWKNNKKPFITYPITNTFLIENEAVKKATDAFLKMKENVHPLLAEILDLNLSFLASEFVKEVEAKNKHRAEYLYSAFFADQILCKFNEDENFPNYDSILYPSVAWKFEHENVAIMPNIADKYLQLVHVREFEVEETYYDKQLKKEEMPVKLKLIREAKHPWIAEDLIVWEDD